MTPASPAPSANFLRVGHFCTICGEKLDDLAAHKDCRAVRAGTGPEAEVYCAFCGESKHDGPCPRDLNTIITTSQSAPYQQEMIHQKVRCTHCGHITSAGLVPASPSSLSTLRAQIEGLPIKYASKTQMGETFSAAWLDRDEVLALFDALTIPEET